MGLRQRHAVLIIYLVTVLTAGIGICMLVADKAAPLLAVLGIGVLLAVFRLAGAVRLRESVRIMQRNLANARMAREDRQRFENVQLMIREARSSDAWWQAVCTMAKDMGFEHVALTLEGAQAVTRKLMWQRPPEPGSSPEVVSISMPLVLGGRAGKATILVTFEPNGSLEAAGRRVTLFGRLIDESFPSAESEDSGTDPGVLQLPFSEISAAPSTGTA
jgi:hypothetical protein